MKSYNFGFAFHKLRTDRGLGIKELAEKAKVSYSMLNMTEKGLRNNPTAQALARITDALGITKQYIFDLAELAPEGWVAPKRLRGRRKEGGSAVL